MQAATKRFQLTFGILSAGYILLGILQFVAPNSSKQVICTVLGIAAIAVGILRIALFLMKKDASRAFQNDLAVGAVLLMGGIYLIVKADAIWAWLPVIIGFAMVFDSIIKLQYAFELKRTGFAYWWAATVAALISTVLAVLLVLDQFTGDLRTYYWATVMILDGVFNLVTMVLLTLQVKKLAKAQKPAKASKRAAKKAKAEKEADAEDAPTAEDVQQLLGDADDDTGWDDEL